MIDLLASASITTDLIEQTSSSARVQEIVRLSLAPAFLLAGIGAVMNVMMSRLIWIAERIERLESRMDDEQSRKDKLDIARLCRRRRLVQRAVMYSTGAALSICVVITLLFIGALIKQGTGTITAIAWITTMIFLITGLVHFAMETVVAAAGQPRYSGDADNDD
ncbi:DUF2721 domain-containing protein [Qipengyuania sp. DGS5-3]|uniref:DUF2721 domain-containing protein n=1 Tax=Qipengyuania sp. DGS5-3 TaxID=3349632 RepID=UPI0036D2423F